MEIFKANITNSVESTLKNWIDYGNFSLEIINKKIKGFFNPSKFQIQGQTEPSSDKNIWNILII